MIDSYTIIIIGIDMKVHIIPEGRKWIYIDQGLPLAYTNVLISDGKHIGFAYIAYDEQNNKYWKSHNDISNIRYWQELPEPPE